MKPVDVFVDGNGKPQHLAVVDERKSHETGHAEYRSLCGSSVDGEVKQLQPTDVRMDCGNCSKQLKLWKEVHSEG